MSFPSTVDALVDFSSILHASQVLGPQRITVGPSMYNVKSDLYGAKGDGSTDDTSAINSAIAAAQASGGRVYFPAGTYMISNSLTITGDNVELVGAGRSTIVQANGSMPASTPMIWYEGPGGAGNFRFGARISDLTVRSGAAPSSVIGIQLDSTYYAMLDHCSIEGVYGQNVYLNGISSAFGAYTVVDRCHIGNVPGGPGSAGIGILTNNHEHNVIRDCTINWFTGSGGQGIRLQNGNNRVDGCDFDECDTGVYNWFQSGNSITNCKFDRGITHFIYLNGCKYTYVGGNALFGFVGSGTKSMIDCDTSSNASNVFVGNISLVSTGWTNFVNEAGGTGTPGNVYQSNETNGLGVVLVSGTARNNRGFNPQGVANISVTASPFTYTNNDGVDEMIYISGGTVSAVAKNATTVYATTNVGVFLEPGEAVTVTYSAAPTMSKDRK